MTTLDTYITFEPNWRTPFKLVYTFETAIMRGIYGYEQRSALFSWPRRTVQYDIQFNTPAESALYKGFISKYMHQTIGVPVWADQTQLTAQATSGQPVLDVTNVLLLNFDVGAWVFIFDGTTYEVGKILSLTSTTLTLTANLSSTWAAGVWVYPMLPMQMKQQVQHRKITTNVGQATMLFKETYNTDASYALGGHNFPAYNGYTVFNQEPNWVNALGWNITRPSERHVGYGVDLSYTREAESEFLLEAQYMGIGVDGVAEIRGLFHAHLGRWKQFWLPTWQKDVVVSGAIGATDTSITVEDFGYTTYWAGNKIIGKHLYFIFPDGSETYRKVIGWPSDTQLNLDGQIGTAVVAGDLGALQVSFLLPARFGVDEIDLNYVRTGLATTRLRMQSIHDEVMTTTTTTTTTTHTATTTT